MQFLAGFLIFLTLLSFFVVSWLVVRNFKNRSCQPEKGLRLAYVFISLSIVLAILSSFYTLKFLDEGFIQKQTPEQEKESLMF